MRTRHSAWWWRTSTDSSRSTTPSATVPATSPCVRSATLIGRAKRRFDSAARVGGEEFAIVVPDTDEHGAYMLAERIRASVAREARADGVAGSGVLAAARHHHRCPAPGRGPCALRRQAAGPQPLGDLERRGARDPGSWRRFRSRPRARGGGRAGEPGRVAGRPGRREPRPLPPGGALLGADRPRARPVAGRGGAPAAGRDPPRRGPRGGARGSGGQGRAADR